MIDFFTGFVAPQFKRFQGAFIGNGALEAGGVTANYDVVDNVTIPYKRNGYLVHPCSLMNTGFGQIMYHRAFAAPETKVIASFWFRVTETGVTTPSLGHQDIFCFRRRTSEFAQDLLRPDLTAYNLWPKICSIAVKASVGTPSVGGLELWDPTYGTIEWWQSRESNVVGTLLDSTDDTTIVLGHWYWLNVTFTNGVVAVYLDGVKVLEGTLANTTTTSASLRWENYGNRTVSYTDYVVQRGADSSVLGPHRVTTLFATGDVVAGLYPTAYAGAGNWKQVSEGYHNPVLYTPVPDVNSYVRAQAWPSYDLYMVQNAYPVGPIVAVKPIALAWNAGSFDLIMRRAADSVPSSVATVTCGSAVGAETSDLQRLQPLSTMLTVAPDSSAWDEQDWIGGWYCGLKDTGLLASCKLATFFVERLHSLSGVSSGNWYAY